MKINGKEIKLFYSNLAVKEIEELCGGLHNLSDLFRKGSVAEQYAGLVSLVRILANANVTKENCEIALGMREGDKKEKYTDDIIEAILDISKTEEYLTEIFEVMGIASKFEIPEGMKLESGDVDLDEIEAERNP